MGASPKSVGIVCGGGDCPGLNAVIRAVVHHATHAYRIKVVGIEGSFQGLLQQPRKVRTLDVKAVSGILQRGGTILGTTNHGSPFRYPVTQSGARPGRSRRRRLVRRRWSQR